MINLCSDLGRSILGQIPFNRNDQMYISRVAEITIEAIATGLAVSLFYEANPALAIAGLSERAITVIGGVFGGTVAATANYLNRRVDRFRPLSNAQIVASRVLALAFSSTLIYLIIKVAGASFGIQFQFVNLVIPHIFTPLTLSILVLVNGIQYFVENKLAIFVAYIAHKTYKMLKEAIHASKAFSPAMPIDSMV